MTTATFTDRHTIIAQSIKTAMKDTPNWPNLKSDMRVSLEMIGHEMADILNGDASNGAAWGNIAIYAKLVADRLS
jgi:hypothetical protein